VSTDQTGVAVPDLGTQARAVEPETTAVPAPVEAQPVDGQPVDPVSSDPLDVVELESTTDTVVDEVAALPDVPLATVLEALLLVTDEPVPVTTLAQVTERPVREVEQAVASLVADYDGAGRGFELRLVAGGWRLYTRADCAPYVERFLLDGQQARLTQAALETLAVIAYRQPVTRARVSAVRGVNVDGVVRTLQARGLIADAGQDPDSAATLFRTAPLFLERLGLQSLDDLPALAPMLPELDELDDASTSM
jgi:segregation and condensation protein B